MSRALGTADCGECRSVCRTFNSELVDADLCQEEVDRRGTVDLLLPDPDRSIRASLCKTLLRVRTAQNHHMQIGVAMVDTAPIFQLPMFWLNAAAR